jgi:hypothetical protein
MKSRILLQLLLMNELFFYKAPKKLAMSTDTILVILIGTVQNYETALTPHRN